MGYSYEQSSSSSSLSTKEKRPPLKRGQLKWQIARTIGNLVAPRNAPAGGGSREKAGDRSSGFSREPSYS
ncbi:hypothetical protein ACP4OV_028833 [Aristida adscensionis]